MLRLLSTGVRVQVDIRAVVHQVTIFQVRGHKTSLPYSSIVTADLFRSSIERELAEVIWDIPFALVWCALIREYG